MTRRTLLLPAAVCLLAGVAGCGGTSGGSPGGAGSPAQQGLSPLPSAGDGTGGDGGGPSAPAAPSAAPSTRKTTTSDWPANGDCVSYHPDNLTVTGSGATGLFTVADGATVVIRVPGQSDDVGQQALALARRYSTHCYLGRTNNLDPKGDYIFDYWRNPSGRNTTITGEEDLCSPYDNKNLTVEDLGDGNGWRVKDHDHVLHLFATRSDADNGALVLRKYSQVCAIGDNDDEDLGQVDYQR